MLGRTTNRFFSYETFVLPGVVTLQVKLLSYPQHRASVRLDFLGWAVQFSPGDGAERELRCH